MAVISSGGYYTEYTGAEVDSAVSIALALSNYPTLAGLSSANGSVFLSGATLATVSQVSAVISSGGYATSAAVLTIASGITDSKLSNYPDSSQVSGMVSAAIGSVGAIDSTTASNIASNVISAKKLQSSAGVNQQISTYLRYSGAVDPEFILTTVSGGGYTVSGAVEQMVSAGMIANSLTVGSVATLDPASGAYVIISGDAPNQIIDFGIPRGSAGGGGGSGGGITSAEAAEIANEQISSGGHKVSELMTYSGGIVISKETPDGSPFLSGGTALDIRTYVSADDPRLSGGLAMTPIGVAMSATPAIPFYAWDAGTSTYSVAQLWKSAYFGSVHYYAIKGDYGTLGGWTPTNRQTVVDVDLVPQPQDYVTYYGDLAASNFTSAGSFYYDDIDSDTGSATSTVVVASGAVTCSQWYELGAADYPYPLSKVMFSATHSGLYMYYYPFGTYDSTTNSSAFLTPENPTFSFTITSTFYTDGSDQGDTPVPGVFISSYESHVFIGSADVDAIISGGSVGSRLSHWGLLGGAVSARWCMGFVDLSSGSGGFTGGFPPGSSADGFLPCGIGGQLILRERSAGQFLQPVSNWSGEGSFLAKTYADTVVVEASTTDITTSDLLVSGGQVAVSASSMLLRGGNINLSGATVLLNGQSPILPLVSAVDSETTSVSFAVLSGGTSYQYTQALTDLTIGSITTDCRAMLKFSPASGISVSIPAGVAYIGADLGSLDTTSNYIMAIDGQNVVCVDYIINS